MPKISINNGNWDSAQNENNTRYRGEGVGTENYSPEIMRAIQLLIEAFLQKKYQCFKEQLSNESDRKINDPTFSESDSGPASIGSPFGPGIIGNNTDGKQPGYAGASNLFVGLPDEDAIELANAIEAIKLKEKLTYTKEVEDNNC